MPTILRPSSIHGIGLFAAKPIRKGTVVWEFTPGWDLAKAADEIETLPVAARDHARRIGYLSRKTGMFIYCRDHAEFFNHSTSPNVAPVPPPLHLSPAKASDEDLCVALRDIAAGEELTVDFREFDADPSDVPPS